MRSFAYARPESLDEATALMSERVPSVRALAGGTDLLAELRDAPDGPDTIVDIGHLQELKGIEETEAGLRIGSLTTHSEIMRDPLVARHVPAMADAARSMGSVQIRNRGTIGGNLASGVPSLDGAPVLLALDALVTVASTRGRRLVPISEFFVGPRRTVLAPDELLVEVILPRAMLGRPAAFWKFGLRRGQALALVNAAASLAVEGGGRIGDVRIALGAVAPTLIRARRAETVLAGLSAGSGLEGALSQAGEVAASEARPIDDFRSSAAYRRDLIRVGTVRVLRAALARASGVQDG